MKFLRASLALVLLASPAHAAQIDAAGAAKLKQIFENVIIYQKTVPQAGKPELKYDGEVMVEPADKYYAVTLPHARMIYPDGSKLDIGMISINASPHDTPGQWKMAVAVPTPIILMDAKQSQAVKVNIGGQQAAGIWDEKLESFAKLDAQYKAITIENPSTGFSVQIPEAQILYDFSLGADSTWTGPGRFLVKDITAALMGGGSAKIAEIKGDFTIDKYNPAVFKEYRDFLKAFLDENAKKPASTPPDPAKTGALAQQLRTVLLRATDSFTSNYTISGLEVTRNNPATGTPETLKLGSAFFGLDAKDLMKDKVSMSTRLGFNGFSITPPPKGYDGVLPAEMNFDISFKNIPAKQIADIAQNTLAGAVAQPEMAQMAGLSLVMKIPGALSQAGSYAEIKNNYIGNDQYRFETNGVIKADLAALNMMTAAITAQFAGLDKLIERVKAIAGDLTNPAAPNAQKLSRSLDMLKAYGAPKPGAEGTYTYDLKVTPEGQMLMNGKPASFGGIPATSPATVVPVAP
jgi:hypothetical protein